MRELFFISNSFAILPNETLETHPMVYGKSLAYWLAYYIQQANPLHINHRLSSPCKLDYENTCEEGHVIPDLHKIDPENQTTPLVIAEHKSWNIICQKKPYLVWISCSSVGNNLKFDLDKNITHTELANELIQWHVSIHYRFGLCSLNNLSQSMKNDTEKRVDLLNHFILGLLRENGIKVNQSMSN